MITEAQKGIKFQLDLLHLYKGVLVSDKPQRSSEIAESFSKRLLGIGVFIDPSTIRLLSGNSLVLDSVIDYIKSNYGINGFEANSTLFKSFDEAEQMSELERFLIQCAHYASTYGGIEGLRNSGDIYEPQTLDLDTALDFAESLTYIKPITADELPAMLIDSFHANIALSEEDIEALVDVAEVLSDRCSIDLYKIYDDIKNKELKLILSDKFGIVPQNFDEFTRLLVYTATGSTLLVNNKQTRDALDQIEVDEGKANKIEDYIDRYAFIYGTNSMAMNIMRYKKIYLVIRKFLKNKSVINRAMKQAKKVYLPRKTPIMNDVVTYVRENYDRVIHGKDDNLKKALKNASTFKLATALQGITKYRSNGDLPNYSIYNIRNGKSWMKENKYRGIDYNRSSGTLADILISNELKRRFNKYSGDYFIFPQHDFLTYAFPTSAKTFVGNIPYMSSLDYQSDIVLGVSWTTHSDLDLHLFDVDGTHYGWNGIDQGESITFSGDMTDTNKYGYATEAYRIKRGLNKPVITQLYDYGDNGENAKYFIDASQKRVVDHLIDDPSGILATLSRKGITSTTDFSRADGDSKIFAVVIPKADRKLKVILANHDFGKGHMPDPDINVVDNAIKVLDFKSKHTLSLNEVLKSVGANIVNSADEIPDGVASEHIHQLDARKVTKDDITKLLDI